MRDEAGKQHRPDQGSLAAKVRSPGAAEPSASALEAGDRPVQTTC